MTPRERSLVLAAAGLGLAAAALLGSLRLVEARRTRADAAAAARGLPPAGGAGHVAARRGGRGDARRHASRRRRSWSAGSRRRRRRRLPAGRASSGSSRAPCGASATAPARCARSRPRWNSRGVTLRQVFTFLHAAGAGRPRRCGWRRSACPRPSPDDTGDKWAVREHADVPRAGERRGIRRGRGVMRGAQAERPAPEGRQHVAHGGEPWDRTESETQQPRRGDRMSPARARGPSHAKCPAPHGAESLARAASPTARAPWATFCRPSGAELDCREREGRPPMHRTTTVIAFLTFALLASSSGCAKNKGAESAAGYETVNPDPRRDTAAADRHNAEAVRHMERGEHDRAEASLKSALAADVMHGPAHNNLGQGLLPPGQAVPRRVGVPVRGEADARRAGAAEQPGAGVRVGRQAGRRGRGATKRRCGCSRTTRSSSATWRGARAAGRPGAGGARVARAARAAGDAPGVVRLGPPAARRDDVTAGGVSRPQPILTPRKYLRLFL